MTLSTDFEILDEYNACDTWCKKHLHNTSYNIGRTASRGTSVSSKNEVHIVGNDIKELPYRIASDVNKYIYHLPQLTSFKNIVHYSRSVQFFETHDLDFRLYKPNATTDNIHFVKINDFKPQIYNIDAHNGIYVNRCSSNDVADLENYKDWACKTLTIAEFSTKIKNLTSCLLYPHIQYLYVDTDISDVYTNNQLLELQIIITSHMRLQDRSEYVMDMTLSLIEKGFNDEC